MRHARPSPNNSMTRSPHHPQPTTQPMYIALGANLGDRKNTIREAVRRIGELGTVEAVSPLYETPAWPDPTAAPAYLNGALRLRTRQAPLAVLHDLLAIERELGRTRSLPNAPRTIDLDVLLAGALIVHSSELTLPHPRLHDRAFVLVPLAAIDPTIIHPVLGRTIEQLVTDLGPGVMMLPWEDGGGA